MKPRTNANTGTYIMPFRSLFYLTIISLAILFSLSENLMALATDRDQPITLEADTADIDELSGISIYTGNVILTQGSMVIKSEKLTLYNDKNKQLEKAVAVDKKNFARFKQRPEGKKQDFKARAITLIYYLKKEKIHLLENARVDQEGGSFSGHKIIYDTKNETVVASSKKDKQGKPAGNGSRVKVTIPAKKKP